jgi:hypothetical protein
LPPSTQVDVLRAVQAFNTFTSDNDPYGEHDFGRVEIGDCLAFWKIDYYDATLRYSLEDPADPAGGQLLQVRKRDEPRKPSPKTTSRDGRESASEIKLIILVSYPIR